MKAAGTALVFLAWLLAGLGFINKGRKQLREMNSLCAAISLLCGELETREESLAELFRYTAAAAPEPGCAFFSALSDGLERLGEYGFRTIWRETCRTSLGVQASDFREEWLSLGDVLGQFELSRQLQMLERSGERLREMARREDSALPERNRLALGICCCLGGVCAIILL